MRFARGDMRDHIVSHKNDHGASYERYGVLQWRSRLRISFCEIFGAAQSSTFATQSGLKQTCAGQPGISPFDPLETSVANNNYRAGHPHDFQGSGLNS